MNSFTKHTVEIDPYTSCLQFCAPSKKALLVVREISQYTSGPGACDHRSNGVGSINIGDALIAVNGASVFDYTPAQSMSLFASQKLPFQASFIRYTASSSTAPFINTRTSVSALASPANNMPRARPMGCMAYAAEHTHMDSYHPVIPLHQHSSNSQSSYCPPQPCRRSMAAIRPSLMPIRPSLALTELVPRVSSRSALSTPVSEFSPISVGFDTSAQSRDFDYEDYFDIDVTTKDLVAGFFRRNHVTSAANSCVIQELVTRTSTFLCNNAVMLDKKRTSLTTPDSQCLISSNGLYYGYHGFSVRIVRCATAVRQEIGVVSNDDVDSIRMEKGGVRDTTAFGARAMFGSTQHANYYISLNDNKVRRSFKRLSVRKNSNKWQAGDVIKVCLNFKKGNIKFSRNDQLPAKTMSLQRNKIYHPFVAFSGDCKYELVTPGDDIIWRK